MKLANKSKEALDCKRLTEELREKEEVEGQLRERIAQLDDSLLSTQHQETWTSVYQTQRTGWGDFGIYVSFVLPAGKA